MMCVPPDSSLAKLGQATLESCVAQHYGQRRLHISKRDDLEAKARLILEKELGDFCWSLDFDVWFVRQLFTHGFLPICSVLPFRSDKVYVLLPKLHRQRCIITNLLDLHIDRGARKRSRKYRLTCDKDFSKVIEGCIEQHGESWLYPPMRQVLLALFQEQVQPAESSPSDALMSTDLTESAQVHSIELWNGDGELVAGELGFSCGSMYTSLTGFYREDGTGTVQLLAFAGLLLHGGFSCWDLGMNMGYKAAFGAHDVSRAEFMTLQRAMRTSVGHCRLPAPTQAEGFLALDLIGYIVEGKTKLKEKDSLKRSVGEDNAGSDDVR